MARVYVRDVFVRWEAGEDVVIELAMAKNQAVEACDWVVNEAVQLHGGAGMSDDFPLAMSWVNSRTLRLADGPDEVHRGLIARLELAKHSS